MTTPQVRVAVRSGTEVPVPSAALETVDYKAAGDYVEDKEKDTLARYGLTLAWCNTEMKKRKFLDELASHVFMIKASHQKKILKLWRILCQL